MCEHVNEHIIKPTFSPTDYTWIEQSSFWII